jgi:hypothetical protein
VQSEPWSKSPSALSKGARFCARLLVFKGLGSFFCNSAKGSILADDSLRRAASFSEAAAPKAPLAHTCQFQRCDRRFRKTYNTRKTRAVSPLTTRALRSSLTDHAPRAKTGFDFLDDRAEDGVDLEILRRVNRRDAGGL